MYWIEILEREHRRLHWNQNRSSRLEKFYSSSRTRVRVHERSVRDAYQTYLLQLFFHNEWIRRWRKKIQNPTNVVCIERMSQMGVSIMLQLMRLWPERQSHISLKDTTKHTESDWSHKLYLNRGLECWFDWERSDELYSSVLFISSHTSNSNWRWCDKDPWKLSRW